jgi:hypothetical protein
MTWGQPVWWRFKNGVREWRYGWPTDSGHGLIRMGLYFGDTLSGPIVSHEDVEVRTR